MTPPLFKVSAIRTRSFIAGSPFLTAQVSPAMWPLTQSLPRMEGSSSSDPLKAI
jgi:hypothetical protein